ncbi:MAG: N,N-dimethylformamidase beta subunit family domain-containing protein, partial [Acidimicrobiales bacterium]
PGTLDGRRLMLSVGHDEYWTWTMRDAVAEFAASGGHVAFLSGNTACWQVRLEEDGRTMVGYKDQFAHDPVVGTKKEQLVTSLWSDSMVGRPENEMTGVTFSRGGYHRIGQNVARGAGGYTVYRPAHWVFEGTGVGYGDLIGAEAVTVGYECDGCALTFSDGLPKPTGADGTPAEFQILALAPAEHFNRSNALRPVPDTSLSEVEFFAERVLGNHEPASIARLSHGHAVMGVHEPGGTVFTSGTTEWVWGVANADPVIERITRNLLERLGGQSATLPTSSPSSELTDEDP